MSKVKRGLQLSAAIVSIVFNSVLIVSGIYWLTVLFANLGGYLYLMTEMIMVYIGIILFGAANIVICSLLCVNPDKKKASNEHKGLTITALVLSGLLAVLYLLAGSLWGLLPLISVGLFIAVLCIPKQESKQTVVNVNMQANGGVMFQNESAYNFSDPTITNQVTQDTRKEAIRQAVENIEKKSGSGIDENITRIRRLHQEGVLTADEMKQLIMEELKKQK